MVFTGKLSAEKRAYVAYLARDKDFKTADICKKSGISRATVYRIKREKQWEGKGKNIKKMGGRPRKLNGRDERKILRALKSLRRKLIHVEINVLRKLGFRRGKMDNMTL